MQLQCRQENHLTARVFSIYFLLWAIVPRIQELFAYRTHTTNIVVESAISLKSKSFGADENSTDPPTIYNCHKGYGNGMGELKAVSGDTSDFIKVAADAIVVNADLPYATQSLFESSATNSAEDNVTTGLKDTFDWDDRFEFSCGVVAFHWSLAAPCHDLNTHNVFLSASSRNDAIQSWTAVRDSIRSNTDAADDVPFNFYVHRASKTDRTAAPTGCDSIMVLVPCEILERRKEYASLERDEAIAKYKEQFSDDYVGDIRSAVLMRLGKIPSLQGLESKIIDEVVDTPATYSDYYNVGGGTPFALSHGFAQLSLTRPSPRYRKSKNTFFVGASTRPGNGVPLVLLGANAIAGQVVSAVSEGRGENETE